MKKVLLITLVMVSILTLCACVPAGQKCQWCGEKNATKSYKNAVGQTIYACSDCYKAIQELNN